MRRGWVIALVLGILLLGGLAAASGNFSWAPWNPGVDDLKDADAGGLEYDLVYEGNQIIFTVHNASGENRQLEFPSGEQYRLVAKKDGATVFDSSADMMFTQQINHVDLEAGGRLTYQAEWQPDTHGAHEIEAYFMAVPGDEPVEILALMVD